MQAKAELDCKGLGCPLPILKTKKAIEALSSGEILKVITTELASVSDMQSWCRHSGHTLLQSDEQKGEFVFYVRKK